MYNIKTEIPNCNVVHYSTYYGGVSKNPLICVPYFYLAPSKLIRVLIKL